MSEPMKHLDDEALSQLREGDLDDVRAAELHEHLEACDECRARAEALDRMIARLTEPPEEEIPPLLEGRLIETYGKPGAEARKRAWQLMPALAGVAAVVAVAAVAVRLYAPGVLGGGPAGTPAGAPTVAEKASAPQGVELAPAPGAAGTADKATADSAAEATSALGDYAGPALPVPLLDTPRVGIDLAYLQAVVSQPGILAYSRRHAQGIAQAWDFRYGGPTGPSYRSPGPLVHEALGLAAANDRELLLAAVREGVSGVEAREAIHAARKAWPGMQSAPAGWVSEAPVVWMARGDWGPTGEEVWVVVAIDVFSPIEGAFKVQAVVLDATGDVLGRAGSGAQTAAPLR